MATIPTLDQATEGFQLPTMDEAKEKLNNAWDTISQKVKGIDWAALQKYAPTAAALATPIAAGALGGATMGSGAIRGGLRAAGATAGAVGGSYLGGRFGDWVNDTELLQNADPKTKAWIKLLSILGGAGLGGVAGYGGARALTGGSKEAALKEAHERMFKQADDAGNALAALGLGTLALAPAAGIGAAAGAFGDGGAARGALRGAGTAAGIGAGGGLGVALGNLLGKNIGDGTSAAGLSLLGGLGGAALGGTLGYKGTKALTKSKKEQLKEAIIQHYLENSGEANIAPSINL